MPSGLIALLAGPRSQLQDLEDGEGQEEGAVGAPAAKRQRRGAALVDSDEDEGGESSLLKGQRSDIANAVALDTMCTLLLVIKKQWQRGPSQSER